MMRHPAMTAPAGHGALCSACGQAIPEYGGITADADRLEVRHGGRGARLTPQIFEVFRFLLNKRGRLARKESLLDWLFQLKPECDWPEDKIADVLVCKLRKALEPIGLEIETVWGVGWYLAEPRPPAADAPAAPGPAPVFTPETVASTVATGDRDAAKLNYAKGIAEPVRLIGYQIPAKKRGKAYARP